MLEVLVYLAGILALILAIAFISGGNQAAALAIILAFLIGGAWWGSRRHR